MLEKRAEQINGDLDQAKSEREDAEKLKEEYKEKLQEARSEAQQIIDEAEDRANKRAKDILKKADEKAEKLKEKKMQEIEQAKKEALTQLRDQIAGYTVLAAGKLIQEQLDVKKHEQLVNEFISELDKSKLGEI